jgi:arginyl-tRNA synthetase
VITLDVRAAVARAATALAPPSAASADPKLRPGARPGTFATPLAFTLAAYQQAQQAQQTQPSQQPQARQPPRPAHAIAEALAARLSAESFIAAATVTGDGFVTVTVTAEALAAVAARVISAGPACARSDILSGVTVPAPPPAGVAADWARAASWEQARMALAAQLTPRLAAAAGATVTDGVQQARSHHRQRPCASRPVPPRPAGEAVAEAVAFAGVDAMLLALARAVPGRPVRIDPANVARQVPGNPAYAVRYAHARAASGLRWVAALGDSGEAVQPCLPADPADWALLSALSWLPERVAGAARRGRPDEFARYLEDLAAAAIAALPFSGHGGSDNERLALTRALAAAARTGLAAGLGLLGVAAPEHL